MSLCKKKHIDRSRKKLADNLEVLESYGYSLQRPPPSIDGYLYAFYQSARSLQRQVLAHEGKEIPHYLKTKKQKSMDKKKKRRTKTTKRKGNVQWPPRDEWERQTERFYRSQEWKELRYEVLRRDGAACQCCGARASDGVRLHVDHIKPRSRYPELQTDIDNLQVLCEDCNFGKSNYYNDDWKVKMQ